MRHFDLTPLYRNSIGFDRLANMVDTVFDAERNQPSYPPFNIEKTAEHSYRISLAVAGFAENDLSIETKDGHLHVKGEHAEVSEEKREFLHRGIASRAFERRFRLADHVYVKAANLENGLLNIELERELPEALKPRKIEIESVKEIANS